MRTLLVPMDYSDQAAEAVEVAVDLVRHEGGRIELLYVAPHSLLDSAWDPGAGARPFLDRMVEYMEGLEAAHPDVPMHATVTGGRPAEAIVEHARDIGADLVVMATHGRSGLTRYVLGSTTEAVLRQAACPVFVVPPACQPSEDPKALSIL